MYHVADLKGTAVPAYTKKNTGLKAEPPAQRGISLSAKPCRCVRVAITYGVLRKGFGPYLQPCQLHLNAGAKGNLSLAKCDSICENLLLFDWQLYDQARIR